MYNICQNVIYNEVSHMSTNLTSRKVECVSKVYSREHLWNRNLIFWVGFSRLDVSELGQVWPTLGLKVNGYFY